MFATVSSLPSSPAHTTLAVPSAVPAWPAAFSASSTLREDLVMEHVGLVRQVARRIHARLPQHMDMQDLVSAGMVGLLDAANKFNPHKQVQFKSYAQIRIRGAILDSLRSEDWSPRDLRRKGRAIAEAIRVLSLQLHRTPTDEEIAGELGMNLLSFQQLTGQIKGLEIGSLRAEREDESDEDWLDQLPAPASDDPLTLCLRAEQKRHLCRAMAILPERERLVLELSLQEGLTLKEIGLTLGVVESRISQIRASAVKKLRRCMVSSKIAYAC